MKFGISSLLRAIWHMLSIIEILKLNKIKLIKFCSLDEIFVPVTFR